MWHLKGSIRFVLIFLIGFVSSSKLSANDSIKTKVKEIRTLLFVDTKKCQTLTNELLSSKNIDFRPQDIAQLHSLVGLSYMLQGNVPKVLKHYKLAYDFYDSLHSELKIEKLANSYYSVNQAKITHNKLVLQLKKASDEGDSISTIKLHIKLGELFDSVWDFDNAVKNYWEALDGLNKISRKNCEIAWYNDNLALVLTNFGNLYYSVENYSEASFFFYQLIDLYQSTDNVSGLSVAYNRIAGCLYFQNNLEGAERFYRKSFDVQEKLKDKFGLAMSLLNLGKLQSEKGNIAQAIRMHKQSVEYAKIIGSEDLMIDNFRELSNLYARQKLFKEAFDYQSEYIYKSEKVNESDDFNKFVKTISTGELARKQQENAILIAKNENYKLQYANERLIVWRVIYGSFLLILLLLSYYTISRYLRNKKENEWLEEQIKREVKKQREQQKIIFHQASLTSLGQMAAGIAHELNQPLQNISLAAETGIFQLNQPNCDVSEVKDCLVDVVSEVFRAKQIVDHVRVFSGGQKDEINEWFDLNDPVKNACGLIRRQIEKELIILDVEYCDNMPDIKGNPYKIEQVVYNLISNSRDAILIDETKLNSTNNKITVQTKYVNHEVIVTVCDNGCGIDEKDLTHIFLPFFTSKKIGKGTGLGLSLSLSFVKEMEGHINVESDKEVGTSFSVIFPVIK